MHREVRQLLADSVRLPAHDPVLDERLDRVLLHPLWGLLVLASVMFVMFQAVYTWAAPLMDAITAAVGALGAWLQARSEERRVGKGCVSTCRSRWWPCHLRKKKHEYRQDRWVRD